MCSWTEPIQAADCLLGKAAGLMNEKADKIQGVENFETSFSRKNCSVVHGFAVCTYRCIDVKMYRCID